MTGWTKKDGVINLYKEAGMTSFGAVARVRRILGIKKIGHAGTLDPMATGVLAVCFGQGTKAVPYLMEGEKTYRFSLRTGLRTDTLDITGTVLEQRAPCGDKEGVRAAAERFIGEIEQIPPMYSALKKDGKKLYELAREGKSVEREARRVTIYALDYLGREENGDDTFRVRCSKGTYVRTLCDDIGKLLGCGATLTALKREQSGRFTLAGAVTLSQLEQAAQTGGLDRLILSLDEVFAEYPRLRVDEKQEILIRNGRVLRLSRLTGCPETKGPIAVYTAAGELLMLARADRENDGLIMLTSFYGNRPR